MGLLGALEILVIPFHECLCDALLREFVEAKGQPEDHQFLCSTG